jgi:hypothetical protein
MKIAAKNQVQKFERDTSHLKEEQIFEGFISKYYNIKEYEEFMFGSLGQSEGFKNMDSLIDTSNQDIRVSNNSSQSLNSHILGLKKVEMRNSDKYEVSVSRLKKSPLKMTF